MAFDIRVVACGALREWLGTEPFWVTVAESPGLRLEAGVSAADDGWDAVEKTVAELSGRF